MGCSPLAFLFAFADPGWVGHLQPPAPSLHSRAPSVAPSTRVGPRHRPCRRGPWVRASSKGWILSPGTGTNPASEPMPAVFFFARLYLFLFQEEEIPAHQLPIGETRSPSVPQFPPLSMQLILPTWELTRRPELPFSLPVHAALDKKQRVLIYGHFCALPRTQRRGKKK